MIDPKTLQRALLAGTVLQVAMVVAGHFEPFVALHVFALGGMAISLLAGLLYGRAAAAYGGAALGGAIAGGGCALIGIALSVLMGDTQAMVLAIGTVSSAVTGAIGGALGRLIFGNATASA
ncbi:MAG TPA: hypothetical protein VHZ29_17655 [Rhizomicrobium sp.]|jgi:hypothetical protein|nr:hypothetical protein [Rhizomicrobium sp.]